jgi:hypothetical protein
MSQLPGRQTTQTPRTQKAKRLPARDNDTESMVAGVILAAIIWPTFVLILWLATRHLGSESAAIAFKPARKPAFDIQLTPDQFIMPRKPAPVPPKFVEANPDAPENIPDKTNNIAARNQQAAQEKPNPNAHGDRAATEGKKDFESNQIVSGRLTPPTEAPPPEPPPTQDVAKAIQKAAEVRKAQNPLPGFEKREGLSPDGFGMNEAKPSENPTPVPEKIEGMKDAPTTVGDLTPAQASIDPRKPQPRVQLAQQHVRPAIFAENKVGTQNIGLAGVDARWSNYGAYLQRLVDSVQIQWERLLDESRIYPPTGTMVTVKFRIEATEGKVTEVINVESTGGQQAAGQCTSAITARSPYGKWTDDMVAVLGETQELEFRFYYGNP